MLREKVAKLAKLLFAGATMALCVAAFNPAVQVQAEMLEESEPNGSPATANKLPLNTWVRGTIDNYSDRDMYQITIPKGCGYSEIEIKPSADNTNGGADWYVNLSDRNRHTLKSYYTHSNKDVKTGLMAGVYYIEIGSGDGSGTTGLRGTYNLIVHYTVSNQWEKEQYYGYKTYGNANTAYVNKVYTGIMYAKNDVDYYRLKLKGNNKISFRFTIDDSVSKPGRWDVKFVEYNSRKELAFYTFSTNETVTIPKCTGDLIVEISTPAWDSAMDQIYHIQASVKTNTIAKPSATTITTAKAGKRQATISWKKAKNATGYYVYRSTNSRSGYKKIATVTGRTSYTDKKSLKSKKTYYYKVVSIRKSGSKVLTAKSSAYKAVKIK